MVKKRKETVKRDKAGKWQKGTKGGPGRTAGTIEDVLCKDGKKRSVATLIDDLLGAYSTMGGGKFLAKWATQNHRNLTKFIDILFKMMPQPTVESSVTFKPLTVQVQKLPEGDAYKLMEKDMKQLRDDNREMSLELTRMRSIFSTHDITYEEIEHEPIRDKTLPSHGPSGEDKADEEDEEAREEREYKDNTDRDKG